MADILPENMFFLYGCLLLFIFIIIILESLASKGLHWVELFPSVKPKNSYVDWKIPPQPPSTQWRVENWCNYSFG